MLFTFAAAPFRLGVVAPRPVPAAVPSVLVVTPGAALVYPRVHVVVEPHAEIALVAVEGRRADVRYVAANEKLVGSSTL